ncbi:SH3-domain kinase binding protein 1 [Mortierella claussenii]|nr:SH3-domain kinase binding protein 1 [Mortierella claussenii]
MATPTYIVHHQYDAEKDDELTLEVGDIITVSDQSDAGWWVGEKVKDGKAGWFPSNFVDPYDESAQSAPVPAHAPAPVTDAATTSHTESADESAHALPPPADALPAAPKNEGPVLARIEYDYEAKESGELSLEAGRVVTILDSSDPAWWKGDLNGKIGTFPSNYVKLIENKDEGDEASAEKPQKFRLAAFGVKQGGLGSLFAGGVVPGLKKTGGLKKLGGVESTGLGSTPAPAPLAPAVPSHVHAPPTGAGSGSLSKRSSMDEPRSPGYSHTLSKMTPPVAEEVIAPLINNPTPARAAPPAPPVEEVTASLEPRVPSRAKKPKAKQIKALVIYEYTAQEDDEISLVKGTTVVVTDKMGDEGWWSGRNEQGEVGNFPSDFVQEIKEEPTVQSPSILPAVPAPAPTPVAVPHASPTTHQDEPPKSPVHSRPPPHGAVALPAIPTEASGRGDPPSRRSTNETPMATPPAIPRSSRPTSMIASPAPSSAQLYDTGRTASDGPPLPGSPSKRLSMVSRSGSLDQPSSPRHEQPTSPTTGPGDTSRSSTLRRPQKSVPEVPLNEADEDNAQHHQHEGQERETVSTPASSHSNRSSYILPTPVLRNRPLPPLARPPSIHQSSTAENRRSVVLPPSTQLPPVPSESEEKVHQAHAVHAVPEEKEEDKQHVEPIVHEHQAHHEEEKAVENHQEHAGAANVASPETIHTEAEEHSIEDEPVHEHEEEKAIHEEPAAAAVLTASSAVEPEVRQTEEHAPVHKSSVEESTANAESHDSEAQETTADAAAEEQVIKESEAEPEKPKLPEMESSGPVLTHASRPRPAKGRKPPSAPVPNPEASFVSQLEADVKAAPIVEETQPEPTPAPAAPVAEKAAPPPPPKPIKPIFQKFPTPFAGASPSSVALRPTGRRAGSGAESSQQSPGSSGSLGGASGDSLSSVPSGNASAGAPPPAGGVKSLSSRFGQFQGVPASGGGNSAALELEIAKLKRWMTEELDRVKKELSDERESREKLEKEVQELRTRLQG